MAIAMGTLQMGVYLRKHSRSALYSIDFMFV